MRSRMGFLGVVALLLALPAGLLSQAFIDPEDETIIHLVLALGFGLLSFAVFDFKTERWLTWVGFAGTAGFAAIVLLQGLSEALPGAQLHDLAYNVLGGELESSVIYLFMAWLVGILWSDSRDRSRLAGMVIMSVVVAVSVYTVGMRVTGHQPEDLLKLVYLAPLVWFLFESMKSRIPETRIKSVLVPAN